MSKRYWVKSYDAADFPDTHWLKRGEFDTAGEALACAHRIVRRSLEELYHTNKRPDADGLMMAYRCHGEVSLIFGEPEVLFNAYEAARWHARVITREAPAAE